MMRLLLKPWKENERACVMIWKKNEPNPKKLKTIDSLFVGAARHASLTSQRQLDRMICEVFIENLLQFRVSGK